MMKSNNKIVRNRYYWEALMGAGIIIALLPSLLRWVGYKEFLPSTGRQDELGSILLCVVGSMFVAGAVYFDLIYTADSYTGFLGDRYRDCAIFWCVLYKRINIVCILAKYFYICWLVYSYWRRASIGSLREALTAG